MGDKISANNFKNKQNFTHRYTEKMRYYEDRVGKKREVQKIKGIKKKNVKIIYKDDRKRANNFERSTNTESVTDIGLVQNVRSTQRDQPR